jgi:hypothetical protein
MKFLSQTRTPSSKECQAVVEVLVGAVVGIRDVQVESWLEEIAKEHHLSVRVGEALTGFAHVLA